MACLLHRMKLNIYIYIKSKILYQYFISFCYDMLRIFPFSLKKSCRISRNSKCTVIVLQCLYCFLQYKWKERMLCPWVCVIQWAHISHFFIMPCNLLPIPTSGSLKRAVIEFLEEYLCQLFTRESLDIS
jgi:hypothetical protein